MKDIYEREVKIGDTVVFNHPEYRLLESSPVLNIVPFVGIKVFYNNPDGTLSRTIVPEKQFVIINKEN